jgi:hypothetical protein
MLLGPDYELCQVEMLGIQETGDNMIDNDTPEMIVIEKDDFELMESDLDYWVAAATMLSELLAFNEIEHEISEEAVAEFLIRKKAELT